MTTTARLLLSALMLVAGASTTAACGGGEDQVSAPVGSVKPIRPAVSPAPGDHNLYLDWDGSERSYELHAPPGYRPGGPVPLVIALHGRPSNAATVRRNSGLDAVADQKGFLVAYPNGMNSSWNAPDCCGQADDVGFLRALVGDLVKTWGVDPTRVYATGISNGASMSYKLAVEASDVFAAIAPVSGGFGGSKPASDPGYKPKVPVSVISFIGNDDRNAAAFFSGLARWQRNLGCAVGQPVWVDKGKTVNRTVSKCKDGSEMVDYTVNGMGHTWPSAAGFQAAIDANFLMWDFFAAHSRSR